VPTAYLLTVVALSSLAAYGVARRWLALTARGLKGAFGEALESLGLVVLFYLGNMVLGVAFALLARAAGHFVSLYLLSDPTLTLASLLQALVLRHWREKEGG
jgi:hypothetical protein